MTAFVHTHTRMHVAPAVVFVWIEACTRNNAWQEPWRVHIYNSLGYKEGACSPSARD